ncbi:phage tail sheath family protein [Streptomyces sp. NPDC048172]|uniref:phage tail sheath family protein n=1 Tax=Streptomyces sp. NPDC048172 TaxID=3365505 RepID=UPI00371A27FE
MALQIGVNVTEVDGRASPVLQAAPTSVAAFAGRTRRGVPNRAVRVTSLDQFAARFGGHHPDGYLPHAVTGFFLNGGREAHIVRVTGAGSAAAGAVLNDRAGTPAPALRVTAGHRGAADPGVWAHGLRIDVRDDPRATTTVSTAATATATALQLASTSGVGVGSVLRVASTTTLFRLVTAVDRTSRTVTLSTATGEAVASGVAVTSAEFRLIVRQQDPATGAFNVAETWPTLSMQPGTSDYVLDRLNHPVTGSTLVMAADLSTAAPGVDVPAIVSGVALSGGSETAAAAGDLVGDTAARTGLHALDTESVQLLALPDAQLLAPAGRALVTRGALDYAAARGDCVYVGSAPDRGAPANVVPKTSSDYTETVAHYTETVKTYAAQFQGAKVYGALYAPWILVADPAGAGPAPVRFVPPDGHVMGVYARTEQERGIHKAPAGDAATLRGALSLAAGFSAGEHDDLVRNGRTNGILSPGGRTPAVAASRTLSTDTRWQFVNVRLLFNFVKSTLRDGLRFVRQEPHTEALRKMVRFNVITPFLLGLWRQGAFGSDPAEQVFTVKCDAENNPPADVDQGLFKVEVYFFPVRPAETVHIIVGQQPGGGSAAEG